MVIAAAPGVVWNSGCYVHYKVRKCQLIAGRNDSDLSKITIGRSSSSQSEVGVAGV